MHIILSLRFLIEYHLPANRNSILFFLVPLFPFSIFIVGPSRSSSLTEKKRERERVDGCKEEEKEERQQQSK